MPKLIKRKQIDLKIKSAPDGTYGYSSNIPNLLIGDDLELAFDKIVTVLDKLAPAMPPHLNQLTLNLTVTGTTSATTGLLTTDGTTKNNIHRFVNGATLTWTTTGVANGVTTRDGHFRDGDSSTAKLRITHNYNSNVKQATINDINLIPIGGTTTESSTSGGYNVKIDLLEKKDYYSDDSASASKSNFYKSIKSSIQSSMVTTFNSFDALERSALIEYSANGSFSDTIYLQGTYRIESPTSPSSSTTVLTIPNMTGQKVSGVPTLNVGDIMSVSSTISNGIKFYYPFIIGSSTMTGTTGQNNTISGIKTPNSNHSYSANHTILTNQYSESISGAITPYDVFGAGTIDSTTDSTKRVDTVSITKATSDASIRRLSPTSSNQYEALSATSYGLTQHGNTLNPAINDAYSYQLQLLNGVYRYPTTDYTTYSGPNYSVLVQNSWRYVDFTAGSITNKTNINLTISSTGISGNPYGTANFRLYIKVEGVTGWLDANAAWSSGTPILDGDPAVDVGNSTSATNRRITFGATRSGNLSVRIGINNGSSITFTGVSIS